MYYLKGGCTVSTESAKKALAEEIWLNYFNKYLLEQGAISETAYRRMQSLIRQRAYKAKQQSITPHQI